MPRKCQEGHLCGVETGVQPNRVVIKDLDGRRSIGSGEGMSRQMGRADEASGDQPARLIRKFISARYNTSSTIEGKNPAHIRGELDRDPKLNELFEGLGMKRMSVGKRLQALTELARKGEASFLGGSERGRTRNADRRDYALQFLENDL